MRVNKTYKNFLPLAVVAMLLMGCATITGSSLNQLVNKIGLGDSRERVLEILGSPGNRSFRGNQEALQYCTLGFFTDSFYTIWLRNSVVESVTNYDRWYGLCSFREVDWGQAPREKIDIDIDVDQDIRVR